MKELTAAIDAALLAGKLIKSRLGKLKKILWRVMV